MTDVHARAIGHDQETKWCPHFTFTASISYSVCGNAWHVMARMACGVHAKGTLWVIFGEYEKILAKPWG